MTSRVSGAKCDGAFRPIPKTPFSVCSREYPSNAPTGLLAFFWLWTKPPRSSTSTVLVAES